METKPFVGWVQNLVGGVVLAAIVGLFVIILSDGAMDARRDAEAEDLLRRVADMERELRQFKKPGGRFTRKNGDDLAARIKYNEEKTTTNNEHWHELKTTIERLNSYVSFYHRKD